jgi:hypothetical protein
MTGMVKVRPIVLWPHPETRGRRRAAFKAAWSDTVELLEREVGMLGGRQAVMQIAVTEADIRLDGGIRATARPAHPGIIVSFDSKHGPLEYATDVFNHWQDNVRAVALGLEALRKVDRYGIAKRGEQYRGWKALEAGGPSPARGEELIREHGSVRAALMATHPDHGGDPDDFAAVQAARETRVGGAA